MEILDRFIKGQNPHSGIDFLSTQEINRIQLINWILNGKALLVQVRLLIRVNIIGKSVPQNIVVTPF